MKMSIQNSGHRRLSMVSFAGLFLLTVLLCCTAFAKAVKIKKDLPGQELELLMEKQKVLTEFSELSKALRKFDDSKRADALTTHQDEADAKTKKVALYQKLLKKDTTRIYNDVLYFMKMADQYYYLIDQMGKESDERMKVCDQELTNLRKQNDLLLSEKNQLQAEKNALELEKLGIKNELSAAVSKKKSGGEAPPVVPVPGNSKDCTPEVEAAKNKLKRAMMELQNNIQQVRSGVQKISPSFVGGKKEIARNKTAIEESIRQLEEKLKLVLER